MGELARVGLQSEKDCHKLSLPSRCLAFQLDASGVVSLLVDSLLLTRDPSIVPTGCGCVTGALWRTLEGEGVFDFDFSRGRGAEMNSWLALDNTAIRSCSETGVEFFSCEAGDERIEVVAVVESLETFSIEEWEEFWV